MLAAKSGCSVHREHVRDERVDVVEGAAYFRTITPEPPAPPVPLPPPPPPPELAAPGEPFAPVAPPDPPPPVPPEPAPAVSKLPPSAMFFPEDPPPPPPRCTALPETTPMSKPEAEATLAGRTAETSAPIPPFGGGGDAVADVTAAAPAPPPPPVLRNVEKDSLATYGEAAPALPCPGSPLPPDHAGSDE